MAAVTFSMSTAPRPHTNPSEISAAKGSTDQHHVEMGKQSQRRRLGVGTGHSVDDRLATRLGLEDLSALAEEVGEGLYRPVLVARLGSPVVDTAVPDEPPQQLDGGIVAHRSHGSAPPEWVRRSRPRGWVIQRR
jgi:hypothetical protein